MNMNDNKLIAEFMGMTPHEQDGGCMIQMTHQGNEVVLVSSMKYHSSWDWLMPVLVKIERIEVGGGTWTSVYFDIEREHKKAVEFIKEHNKSNKMDNLPPSVQ